MPRKPYIPLEIDFILGDDDHFFPEVSGNGQKLYLGCYCWAWKHGGLSRLTQKRVQLIGNRLNLGRKQRTRAVEELSRKGFFQETEGGHNIPKLKEKREKAFNMVPGENTPKDSDKNPENDGKPNQNQTKPKETKKETKPKESNPKTQTSKTTDSEFPNGEKPLAYGNCPMAKETLSNVIRNHWPNAEDLILALSPLGLDQNILTAYFLDAKKADNPQGWLVKVLYAGKYKPTKTAMNEIEKISKKMGQR